MDVQPCSSEEGSEVDARRAMVCGRHPNPWGWRTTGGQEGPGKEELQCPGILGR